jgi:1-acyl-sn-glycerol-3-phosphate acyltransferase
MIRFWEWLRNFFPWFVKYYNRLELRGIENLPQNSSAIIAPNHSGGLDYDSFSLMSSLDRIKSTSYQGKRIWLCFWDIWSIGNNPWASWVQKFTPIPINLEGEGIPFKLVDKLVEKGELIAIMPEGHSAAIQEGYRLWKFYPGVIRLHLRYKIPIIPTASIGFVQASPILAHRYNPKKIPPWEKELMVPFILPRKLIFHFGEPIMFEDYFNKEVPKKQMYYLAYNVKKEVKNLISKYYKNVSYINPYGK